MEERFRKRRRRVSRTRSHQEQLNSLLSYMEDHSEFAKAHITNLGASGHDKYRLMWTELTTILNDQGPVTKNTAGWQRTWKYLKSIAKTRKAEYTVTINKTGNNGLVEPLCDFHQRITAIFGKHGTGLSVIKEVGIIKKRKLQYMIEPNAGPITRCRDDIGGSDYDGLIINARFHQL